MVLLFLRPGIVTIIKGQLEFNVDMIQIDVVYKVIIIQHAFVADKVILA